MPDADSARPPESAFATVDDPEQARLLTDPLSLRFFEPFLAREQSASQAAAELGVRLDTLLYRLRVLQRAGLVRVVRSQKRAGRPVKIYRSSADAYFIPFGATPYAELEERIREQLRTHDEVVVRALARTLRASGYEGQRLYRDARGEVFRQSAKDKATYLDLADWASLQRHVRDRAAPATERLAAQLALTDEEAKSLLLELYGLWRRYGHEPAAGARGRKPYDLQFVLVPLPDEG